MHVRGKEKNVLPVLSMCMFVCIIDSRDSLLAVLHFIFTVPSIIFVCALAPVGYKSVISLFIEVVEIRIEHEILDIYSAPRRLQENTRISLFRMVRKDICRL